MPFTGGQRSPVDSAIGIIGRHLDAIILVSVTLLAALLRLWDLGDVPQGIHGDEAQFGMDAQRVLSEGWIGPYTGSALGQPSGIAYVIAPAQWLLGASPLGVRLGVAIFAVAAIPLTYVLFRLLTNRVTALLAALLLAVSLWHIHLSRVAYQPALVPTTELAVLVFWALAIQRGNWYWFVLSGATLGLGLYTYTAYPIFVFAFAFYVAIYTLGFKRGAELLPWVRRVGFAALASIIIGLPLFAYIADPSNDYFSHYRYYYESHSLLQSDDFEQANLAAKLDLVFSKATNFIGAYAWHGVSDFIDGASPDKRPMLNQVTLALLIVGIVWALWHWREPANLLSLVMLAVIPLSSILQTNATYRGPLGAVPFVAYLAAVPLALAWAKAPQFSGNYRWGGFALVPLAIAFVAYTSVQAYFGTWSKSSEFRWVYSQEVSSASEYLESLPGNPYVYFYSERWSFNFETRKYLAPQVRGEDRSKQFGQQQGYDIDRSRDSVLLLLPPYIDDRDLLRTMYPEGSESVGREGERVLYFAYKVPATDGDGLTNDTSGSAMPPEDGDARRRSDLRSIADALAAYLQEHGLYPSTNGHVQTACAYPTLDRLCVLEGRIGDGKLVDPRGHATELGYWYMSDGSSFTLFATLEKPPAQAERCTPAPESLRQKPNVLCLRSGP
jgi:4-amino-4-deoxy-L-arabinose transferase-like glycosyltransferase